MNKKSPLPNISRDFLKTFLNFIQILFGAGHWVTIAANKYEGSIHLVLFVAVLFLAPHPRSLLHHSPGYPRCCIYHGTHNCRGEQTVV
uniref:Uncharacterized protein n=1 Tax=Oncorhynchus mykiss TaxID=8022 RepID=A0A8K9URJ1_ONCMY